MLVFGGVMEAYGSVYIGVYRYMADAYACIRMHTNAYGCIL